MTRPANVAREFHKGFESGARTVAERHTHAYVTSLMAVALTLATLVAVATVSIEVVKAAALH
jgi:hypothetical protein